MNPNWKDLENHSTLHLPIGLLVLEQDPETSRWGVNLYLHGDEDPYPVASISPREVANAKTVAEKAAIRWLREYAEIVNESIAALEPGGEENHE